MAILLFLLCLAGMELTIGALMAKAGARILREHWILRRRGVRIPAIAERLMSPVGTSGVYRFLDTEGRTRVANAERVRRLPAVEVEIVYDPRNTALAREASGMLTGVLGVLSVLVGAAVMGLAAVSFAMLGGIVFG